MDAEKNRKELVAALYLVIDEFEDFPIQNIQANNTMLEILSERIEIVLNR